MTFLKLSINELSHLQSNLLMELQISLKEPHFSPTSFHHNVR